jgi:hypothetical protein
MRRDGVFCNLGRDVSGKNKDQLREEMEGLLEVRVETISGCHQRELNHI